MVNTNFSGVEFPFLTSVPNEAIQQKMIAIPAEHNFLDIILQGNSWVSVSVDNQQLVCDRSSNPNSSFHLVPGTYIISTDGTIQQLISRSVQIEPSLFERLLTNEPSQLRLTSDAPDRHIVDGVGEVPADGNSFCTITVEKISQTGELFTGEEHQDELFLRTTGGVLMDAEGQNRIRSLNLKAGRAAFRLVSEASPKIVTVSVFGKAPLMPKAEIQIEFV